MIAAGVGCRKGCARSNVLAAVHAALAHAGRTLADVDALYIPAFKRDEQVFYEAARELEKPLRVLSLEALRAVASRALTSSERVQAEFGLPSVAETAALAGATLSALSYACPCPCPPAALDVLKEDGKHFTPDSVRAGAGEAHGVSRGDVCSPSEIVYGHGHAYEGEAVCRLVLLGPRVVVGGATCALAVCLPQEAP